MVTPFHLLRLWLIQLRYAASRELAFRANFFAWVVVELAWFILQLAFVGVVYQHVESVAGWSRQEMIVLVATSVLAKLPAVPVEDPFLEPHPWDVHVHSLDHHHGSSHHA
jgi:ABC-type uncharacterized transport system permease subunit